jgi:hypothetical protein
MDGYSNGVASAGGNHGEVGRRLRRPNEDSNTGRETARRSEPLMWCRTVEECRLHPTHNGEAFIAKSSNLAFYFLTDSIFSAHFYQRACEAVSFAGEKDSDPE